MNRAKNLFEKICDIQNLHEACYKAAKHKGLSLEYLVFREGLEHKLEEIRMELLGGEYRAGEYRQFKISDPKERTISAAPFKDRVIHHAIINILEPVFERQFIFHTYACRKGKGTHAAARYAFKKARVTKYFLKLDVRKYFDSISHVILKKQLCHIIKDERCLSLLFVIIESYSTCPSMLDSPSGNGLPIGNLTSQFFANLYLSPLDHFVLENLKPAAYIRYMDDMILFAHSMSDLKNAFERIKSFCMENLSLHLKQEIFGTTENGVPFLGWRITNSSVTLLAKTKRRKKHRLRQILTEYECGLITEEKAAERMNAVCNVVSPT